jgi:hypothetical protein
MNSFGPSARETKPRGYEVYDLETSTDLKNVFLAGWYDGREYRYWESALLPPDHPDSAVAQFCTWYFSRKRTLPIYAHNGGNFDHLFVLKWLLANLPQASVECVPTQSSILLMTVKVSGRRYEFRDSMRLMVAGLDSLAKAMLGSGKVEGINYDTLHLDPRRFSYLQRDCVALYNCLLRFRETVETRLGGEVGLTAAATAIRTLRTGYLDRNIRPLTAEQEKMVRAAYYGGRTEVFHHAKDIDFTASPLRCYDINSMYAWALSRHLPVDVFHTDPNCEGEGFVTCTVDTRHADKHAKRFPCLPYRQGGKLLFPLGRFRGTWSTIELHLAELHGYTLTHKTAGLFFRLEPVFEHYVSTLYKLRDKTDPKFDETISRIAKLLLNATYGKFGTNRERELIHIRPSLSLVLERGMRPMQGPMRLPVYLEEVRCEADYVLPHLAAWVTALARVRLLEYIYACSPHRVFYCDTDSVYTTAQLTSGTGLGEMKEEYSNIVRAEFVCPKVYRLTHADGSETVKAKGFSQFARGFAGNFDSLRRGESQKCSAFSKVRTVLRGDFGLLQRSKQLRENVDKRRFLADGSSVPLTIYEA